MKINFSKKIILFIALLFFIFGLTFNISSVAAATTLQVKSSTTTSVGKALQVIIQTSPAEIGWTIQFLPQDPGAPVPFSSPSCMTGNGGYCFGTFLSNTTGVFKVKASGFARNAIPNLNTDPHVNFDITVMGAPTITANYASAAKIGQDVPINVQTLGNVKGVTVSFKASGVGASFSPSASCLTGDYGSCQVNFKSNQAGVFNLTITASGYTTNSLAPITVAKDTPTPPTPATSGCVPPATLSSDGICVAPYVFLAPLSSDLDNFIPGESNALSKYLNIMIKIFIGICAVLAVIMIVMGGIEYMTSELVSSKEAGKERITHAIFGLLLALGAYALLFTINPDLLNSEFDIPVTTLYEKDNPPTIVAGSKNNLGSTSASCPGGLVTLSSTGVPIKAGAENELICKDMIPILLALKSKVGNWYVTAAIEPGHESDCHKLNKAKSGNCFDLAIKDKGNYGISIPNKNPLWGDICKAIASMSGINFANEASDHVNCGTAQPYSNTSGANIHVNRVK
ncbi:MAG: hypothetical protein ABIS26_01730 [Candidatus Paceibacterota bacterium]